MSYDTDIIIGTGAGNYAIAEEIGNYTSNVGGMFRAALGGPHEGGGMYDGTRSTSHGPYTGLPGISGLKCSDALPIVTAGVEYMEQHVDEMRAMNPENGWGCYEGALDYLRRLRNACADHPDGTIAVNW